MGARTPFVVKDYNDKMLPRIFTACLLTFSLPLQAEAQLAVHYLDKPPYYYTQNGSAAGFLNQRMKAILVHAGLKADFSEVPAKRILAYLQLNQIALCSPGWYKTPEREHFARFSLPIFQDPPPIVLARPGAAPAVRAKTSLHSLLSATELRLLLTDGFSYGKALDVLLAKAATPPLRHTVNEMRLAKMLQAERGDYMLIDRMVLKTEVTQHEINKLGLVQIDFPDMPLGEKRYLMCSQKVDDKTMEQINLAIRQLPVSPR